MKTITNANAVKILLLSFMVAGTGNAAAEEDNRNPIGCQDVGYEFQLKTLRLKPDDPEKEQAMYFMFNTRNQKVTLFQMRGEESSRTMYLNHSINPGQWGVLSTTEKNMKYICTVPGNSKSPYGKIVDCAESLRICEYTHVKYGMNNRGNYWLVNSNTKNGAIRDVVRYGIIPGA